MTKLLCCSFCGKSEHEIEKLVAGPSVHICNACVDLCYLVMRGDTAQPTDFAPANWPTERLLQALGPLNATSEAHRRHLGDVVDTLRGREISWAKIGEQLGVSRQTAWERFG